MTLWGGLDRRRFPRLQYPCLVIIRHSQGEKEIILTHTENVGIGGICITLKQSLKMFAPVEVELDLLDFENHIKCEGKIVWSVRRKSEEKIKPLFYDIGVEFTNLQEQDRSRLEGIIQNFAKHQQRVSHQ